MSYLGYDLRNIALPLSEKISLNKDDSRISRTVHDSHGLTPSSVQLTDEDITSISYFDDKEIFTHLNEIVERLLKDRPEDPESYILRELRIWDGKESGNEYTEVLLHERSGRMQAPTNKNFLFHAQFQEAEKKNRAQLEKERQALDYERIRAFDFTSSTEEHHEKPVESSRAREVILLKQLIEALNQRKTQLQADSLARTIDLGESGEPLLSTKMLRFVIGLGITGDESQLSSNALKFYRKCIQNANVIPLEHPFRLSYEGPLHFSDLHALHDPLALNVFPVQGPSVCYQAVHKLLIEYSYSQGKEMHDQNIQDASPRTAAKHGQNLDGKGMHIVFQFHVLMRVCHMWLVVATEPVKEWSRLLHLSLYTLIGYEGFYLSSRLIADLGRAFEEVFLVELHSALRKERSLEASCFLNAQVCFRWIVKESTHILEDLKTPHTHVNEDQSFSSSQMTVKKLLESVLSNTMHRPHRLEETTLFQISSPDDAPHLLSKTDVSLDFSRVTEARIQNARLTSRCSLLTVTETSELLDFFQQFETKPIMEVADQLDILAFGERDDLAVLLSVALQCMEDPIGSSGLSHVTKIREIAPRSADILFLRSKLVVAFVGAIVAAQYESTIACLNKNFLHEDYSSPMLAVVLGKMVMPHSTLPSIFEVFSRRFRFCDREGLTAYFAVVGNALRGEKTLEKDYADNASLGLIYVNYVELAQITARYLRNTESFVAQLYCARWHRLLRTGMFFRNSLVVFTEMQAFSKAFWEKTDPEDEVSPTKRYVRKITERSASRIDMEGGAPVFNLVTGERKNSLSLDISTLMDGEPKNALKGVLAGEPQEVRSSRFEKHVIEKQLFSFLRGKVSENSDSGLFLDAIENPVTRERLTPIQSSLTIKNWNYVAIGAQCRNSALWCEEFSEKISIMVNCDIGHYEITKVATAPLSFVNKMIQQVETACRQRHQDRQAYLAKQQQKAERLDTSYFGSMRSTSHRTTASDVYSPQAHGMRTPRHKNSNKNTARHASKHSLASSASSISSKQTVEADDSFPEKDVLVYFGYKYSTFSHLFSSFLYQMHNSGCPSFVFSEAQSRWNSISEVEQEKIITKSLPQDVSFSSASYEKSRSRLRFCLDRLFSGEISLEKNIDLVLVLFRCGVMPCRYFDFFSSIQTLVNLVILTPNAPPYFTHLAHRVLRSPLFQLERHLDYYTRGKEPMREAWEQYLRDPSAVFEASKALLDLLPREVALRGDVTLLREKMRLTPQKYVQIYSSYASEKDIMLVSVWFRLHSDIPQAFLEAFGVTLYDIFLSSYDQSYSMVEEVQQILRVDRAFRVILSSSQPKMGDLERLQKLVQDAVAPKYKFPRTLTINEELKRSAVSSSEQAREYGTCTPKSATYSVLDDRNSFLSPSCSRLGSRAMSMISMSKSQTDTPSLPLMKLFDTLMSGDIVLDGNAWRCHPLSVRMVYAITHPRTFAGSHYAEATQRYLLDLCFLLHYVRVDTYVHYFYQFFVRLLTIGHTPKLLEDTTERFFETLHALQIPFDIRMIGVVRTILSTHLERCHDEAELSYKVLNRVKDDVVTEAFVQSINSWSLRLPLTRLCIYNMLFPNILATSDGSDESSTPCSIPLATPFAFSFTSGGATSTIKKAMMVVSQPTMLMEVVISLCFSFLHRLSITLLENSETPELIIKEVEELFEEELSRRAMQILALLSCGTTNVAMDLISLYGRFIQQNLLPQSIVGPYPVVVWSRVFGNVSSIVVDCLEEVFTFSDGYKKVLELLPHQLTEVKNSEVPMGLERLMVALSGTVFINGMYLSGSVSRYFLELSSIVYSALLDYQSDNTHTAKVCWELKNKLEGTSDDIVVGMCCLLPVLGKYTEDYGDLLKEVTASKQVPQRKKKPVFNHFPPLVKIMFSCIQQLTGFYDDFLRCNIEKTLVDRMKTSTMLRNALAEDYFPISYEDGAPISMRVLLPEPLAEIKRQLIESLISCVESVYVMRAEAAGQIEKRNVSSVAAAELERGVTESTNAENLFLLVYKEQVEGRLSFSQTSDILTKGADHGTSSVKGRVMPFFLYHDMVLTDPLMDALSSSGLMSADVMRFSTMFENHSNGGRALNTGHNGKKSKTASALPFGMGSLNATPFDNATPEEDCLANIWRSALCLASQNFRRVVMQSKLSLNKEASMRTTKALLRIQPLIYVDLLKKVESQTDYVEWLGQSIPFRPYLEEWLLPVLFRTFCLVEDRQMINATRRMRKELEEKVHKLQQAAQKNHEESFYSDELGEATLLPTGTGEYELKDPDTDSVDSKRKKKSMPTSARLKNAGRSVITQKLPLKVLQDILLDMTHPQLQETLMSVLNTVEANCENGAQMKWNLSRSLFFQVSQQRLVMLGRRFCLSAEECDELTELWKEFRARDKGIATSQETTPASSPTANGDALGTPGTSPRCAPISRILAVELSSVLKEPLQLTEALIVFLDRLFITQLKSIFRWNSPTASLLAMYIYTDSVEFHRALYFLRSRWCLVAITICNVLQALGGMESEDQFLLLVRVLRGIRLMRCAVEHMADPKNILSFLQSLPYQKLINICQGNDIQTLALAAVPATVNRSVVEKSLETLVTNLSDLLVSLRAMHERLQAGHGCPNVIIRPTDLLQLFVDWSNINGSQGKDVTRASFRGLALLISTSLNSLTEKQANAIFANVYPIPPPEESPFSQRGGLGNSILADQFRLLFTFCLVCCNGLRPVVKSEKYVSTSFLPDYAIKEVRLTLPTLVDGTIGGLKKHASAQFQPSDSSSSSSSCAFTFSRTFYEMCIVGTINKILDSNYVTFTESRTSRYAESAFREDLLKLLSAVMNFVSGGLKGDYGTLTILFKEQLPRIKACVIPGEISYEELCLFCFHLLQEISDRGRLVLTPSIIQSCDVLISTFCRSVFSFFFDACGERHSYIGFLDQVYRGDVPSMSINEEKSVFSLGRSEISLYASFHLAAQKENTEGLLRQAQSKISSGKEMESLEKVVNVWKKIIRVKFCSQFPYAEFKIFCFLWVSLLSELRYIMTETTPLYVKQFKELTSASSSEEELRSFLVFLHHLSFDYVAEQWVSREIVEASVREWINTFAEKFCANTTLESAHKRVWAVASCALHSMSMTIAQRVFRYDKIAGRGSGSVIPHWWSENAFQSSKQTNASAAASKIFSTPADRYSNLYQRLLRPAWTTAMLYIIRCIDVVRKGSKVKGDVIVGLAAPRVAVELRNEQTVAVSSRLFPYIESERENENDVRKTGTFSSFSNFLASSGPGERKGMGADSSPLTMEDSTPKNGKSHSSFYSFKVENQDRRNRVTSILWDINDVEDERGEKGMKRLCDAVPGKVRIIDGYVTPKDLAAAHTPECTWTVINGVVYDITKFAMIHPGGSTVLISHCAGQDCTDAFVKMHLGNEKVLKQLEKMRIGEFRE